MLSRGGLGLVVAWMLVLATAGGAEAAITVANQNDSGAGSLRQAVEEASPGETINVPAGTYSLTSGPLQISKALTISGHAAGDTVIRSGGPSRVIESGGEFDLTISGVTIRDGNVVNDGTISQGGGIFTIGPRLTLRGVVVTSNTANASGSAGKGGGLAQGGGLFVLGGALNLIDSSVTGNTAAGNGGSGKAGTLAQGGGVFALSNLTASNSTISGNVATTIGGQGPSNGGQNGGLVQGSGLFALSGSEQPVAITGVTVAGNVADASGGPGANGGTLQGGGVFLLASVPVSLTTTTIAFNVARSNGATAGTGEGGGMFLSTGEPTAALLSTTVSGNRIEPATASGGGGNLFTTGSATIRNSIVANGVGPTGSENCVTALAPASLGFNIDNLDQCGFKAAGDKVNADPLLGPLQSNGGPTQTMVPASNSPAVDQGSASGLTADQRGVVRPIDLPSIPNSAAAGADGTDIGATELQPSNGLTLGKLKKNKKKGTAKLTVFLPQPSAGTLTLTGKGLKTQTTAIAGQSELKLKVLPKGKVKKALKKKGKRKVQINVTYSPTGNNAATATRKAKLVKKHKKRKRKKAAKR